MVVFVNKYLHFIKAGGDHIEVSRFKFKEILYSLHDLTFYSYAE